MPTKEDILLPIASNTYAKNLSGKYSLQAKILLKPGKIHNILKGTYLCHTTGLNIKTKTRN